MPAETQDQMVERLLDGLTPVERTVRSAIIRVATRALALRVRPSG